MANEHAVCCGGAPERDLPCGDVLRLRMWGQHRNVRFVYEDVLRGMWGEVPAPLRDLIDVAVYVYAADRAIARCDYDDPEFGAGWRRRLFFRVPVRHPDLWNDPETSRLLAAVLSFLSEDEYHFRFEPLEHEEPFQHYARVIDGDSPGEPGEVVLFSGGLDSTAGAVVEAVRDRRRVVLVQHRPSPKPTRRQRTLFRGLCRHAARPPVLLPIRANIKKGMTRESSQRTRSFLFAALGAALARMLGLSRVRFYENGVVSFNLPPSAQVVGARASRTTHPQTLAGLSRLFSRVAGDGFRVENPFEWTTKREAVELIAGAGCADLIGLTDSCTRPRQARREQPHCGRCSQCIDRRFAVLAAGQGAADPEAGYQIDLLRGERKGGHPRTMLAVYVEMASQLTRMNALEFFGRYGEAGRVLRHMSGSAEVAARRLLDLYQRHARDVLGVVTEGVRRYAQQIAERSLPASCLIRLVCDTSPAATEPPPRPAEAPARVPECVFRRRGQVWEYRYAGGRVSLLMPSKGAAYLHQLLSRPGEPVTAVDLAFAVTRDPRLYGLGDAGEVLDEEGRTNLRAAAEDCRERLEQARQNNDLAAIDEQQRTLSWLAEMLGGSQGLNERDRKASDDREKVRKAAGNAIRRAVRRIAEDDKAFGEHLRLPRLTGGASWCYQPGEDVCWVTE
jgi:7-cyano-7-deazaguanine synthase in queuosine biosynthesis